jgi:hypothetical protein
VQHRLSHGSVRYKTDNGLKTASISNLARAFARSYKCGACRNARCGTASGKLQDGIPPGEGFIDTRCHYLLIRVESAQLPAYRATVRAYDEKVRMRHSGDPTEQGLVLPGSSRDSL